jgi:hypothetical protein
MLRNTNLNRWKQGATFLALLAFTACSNSGSGVTTKPASTVPTVLSNTPLDGASGAPVQGSVSASFSEAMDGATLTSSTFLLTLGAGSAPVQGTVTYTNSTAVFTPASPLAGDSSYTAMLTTGAKSASGVPLRESYVWTIRTGIGVIPVVPVTAVNLGTAANFVMLAQSGISNVPPSAITGHIGVSPITSTAITGFTLIADPSNIFSTSTQVTGKVYAASYAAPTPSNMGTAVSDMVTAYTDAAGRTPNINELGTGNIGGMTLLPGVYKWNSSVLIPANVILSGSATDVWIFEIAQNLTMANATSITLTGGALPKNIFWQVSGAVNIGSSAHLEGVVLSKTAITMGTGASINGRLLTQTAITLDGNTLMDSGNPIMPAVLSTTPLNGATGVTSKAKISATFSVPMDLSTLNASTFTLASSAGPVSGIVMRGGDSMAIFTPNNPLASRTTFTATITTGAKSASSLALPANYTWSFTTGGGIATTPIVQSTIPINGVTGVPINGNISATFSEAMDSTTLTTSTFKLASGAGPVPGAVNYANLAAVFNPTTQLASNTLYTATVTTGAKSLFGVALAANYVWSFTTGTTIAPTLPVNLGTAGNFVILSKSGISTVPASSITGNIGVSPAAATLITGFALTADPSNVFSTSTQVVGKVYAANYAPPTPTNLSTAVGDMQLAFTDAAGRVAGVTELGAGNIGGLTIAPGVYKWGSAVLIPSNVTLNGSATDIWIFQIAQNLIMANATNVYLTGGALAKNVFWQVSGLVDVGTTAHMEGVVLSQTAIRMKTGSSVNGRLLAQTAVALDTTTVVQPAP